MNRRFISMILIVGSLVMITPRVTHAFNPFGLVSIISTINNIVRSTRIPTTPSAVFPFGGRITESGTACKLHYWMSYPVPFPPFFLTHPGVSIPLFGTKIRVSPPGLPVSDVFTFPGITKIYANKHEDRVGVWTLGISSKANFVRSLISRINSALSSIPPIVVGPVTFFNFSLSCPDGGIILKIGTS